YFKRTNSKYTIKLIIPSPSPLERAGVRSMAKLQDILYNVRLLAVKGITNMDVKDIQIDSRKVTQGSVFVAITGTVSNGHDFIDTAIQKGATVIVCEVMPAELKDDITYLQVN